MEPRWRHFQEGRTYVTSMSRALHGTRRRHRTNGFAAGPLTNAVLQFRRLCAAHMLAWSPTLPTTRTVFFPFSFLLYEVRLLFRQRNLNYFPLAQAPFPSLALAHRGRLGWINTVSPVDIQ